MKTFFVIGGIGSGKSTVTRYFASREIPTLDLDRVGHEVLGFEAVKTQLVENFGEDILGADGQIMRSALAAEAFATPEATALLTGITSPFIITEMRTWERAREAEGAPFAIVEVSAFDGPQGSYGHLASGIIAVVAPLELRVSRATKNDFKEEDIRQRIARQVSDEKRRSWAQYVIENDGTEEDLYQKLDALRRELEQ